MRRSPVKALSIAVAIPISYLKRCLVTGRVAAVLVKHFADRQLHVAPEVIAYLLRRMERSFAAAANITARLDAVALRNRCAVTISLVRNILAQGTAIEPSYRPAPPG
jgi:chromosomal replication initiation ATPase DnaA